MTRFYAIRDIKNAFEQPFTAANDAIAMRNFKAAKANKESILSQFPEDFELWFVGAYDEEHGLFVTANHHQVSEGENDDI